MTKVGPAGPSGWLHGLVLHVFAFKGGTGDATWAVFFIPAAILLVWVLLDWWLIKDTPEEAGFPAFDPADASTGHMDEKYTALDLLKRFSAARSCSCLPPWR